MGTEGKVSAGGHGKGSKLTHLHFPVDIAIDSHHHDSLVIVDRENHRVVDWAAGATEGTLLVGSDKSKSGDSLHDLKKPNGVTIDSHGHIIVADTGNHRILKCQRGHRDCTVVVSGEHYKADKLQGCGGYDVHSPEDVEVDAHGNYIITDKYYDRVVECNGNGTQSHGHIIAGGKTDKGVKCKKDCYGSDFHELYYPEGTAMDEHGNYIVADAYNNRIMKWAPGASQGQREVSKKDSYGRKLSQLHFPRGLIVDQGDYIIADSMNHRILRWHPGADEGVVVAGGHGYGSKKTHLHIPEAVAVLQHNNSMTACPHASSSPRSLTGLTAVLLVMLALANAS